MTGRRATTTLWRPTGPEELELVRELDWRAWPPRLLALAEHVPRNGFHVGEFGTAATGGNRQVHGGRALLRVPALTVTLLGIGGQ
ncbi:hypothetical protein GCM10010358_14350 [Streptomyces minutiscleroticus]|uniref:Uncharacterized protein n=1 Tax=Streptomyces minutiscleroticus TaxID=68238 RepID=A0A918KFV9_9ACTN|nr:hypothetical protein GCM10010358_14350 [Streptomyces minutiscleroticus]